MNDIDLTKQENQETTEAAKTQETQSTESQPTPFQTIDNPEIPMFESSAELPDMEQFEGARVQVEGWSIIDVNSKYDPKTGDLVKGEPVKVKKLKIFSAPVAQGKKEDGTEFPIRGTLLIGMKLDKEDKWGLSTHKSSNIQKFFRKLKVNSLSEIKGKYVTLTLDENQWLRIVY